MGKRKPEEEKLTKTEIQARYDAVNTKQYKIKLNLKTDGDIIKKLDSVDNRQGYIKDCIRKDIKSSQKNQ